MWRGGYNFYASVTEYVGTVRRPLGVITSVNRPSWPPASSAGRAISAILAYLASSRSILRSIITKKQHHPSSSRLAPPNTLTSPSCSFLRRGNNNNIGHFIKKGGAKEALVTIYNKYIIIITMRFGYALLALSGGASAFTSTTVQQQSLRMPSSSTW